MASEEEDVAGSDEAEPLRLVRTRHESADVAELDPRQAMVRDRALRLFTFLREFVQLRTKIVRSLSSYEQVLWLSDIPKESECFCHVWDPDHETEEERPWVEVGKPRLAAPPKIPSALNEWVNKATVGDSSREEPEIYPQIAVPRTAPEVDGLESEDPGPRFLRLEDRPDIRAVWDGFLDREWRPWAEVDRRKQRVKKIYGQLFHLHHQQAELGESYEVVMGLGLLKWRSGSGHEVCRHLITAQTSVEFDSERGVVSVTAAGEGAKPQLEHDMLEPEDRPGAAIEDKFEEALNQVGDDIWGNELVESSLKSWINSMGKGDGEYSGSLDSARTATAIPSVVYAPALILRKRSDRGFLELYKQLLVRIEAGEEIPEGVVPLIDIDAAPTLKSSSTGAGSEPSKSSSGESDELYFPLPSNDEQRQIIHQLADNPGVLVQGPPGTGKSHTIANLVCHLLASGKRVLVTSQTARALRVLKDKIPEEISVHTLRNWEQGRRQPEGPAIALLKIAARHPNIVRRAAGRKSSTGPRSQSKAGG
jgi:hypothetical protein